MSDETDRRKRLIYRSWHRGTREMDLLLGSFADRYVPGFDAGQLDRFEKMLNISDPDLYDWVSARVPPPANALDDVLELFLSHRFAEM
jgi:antitoxin CptB